MRQLQRLESWIAQLVEEPFVRLFADQLLPQDVAMHLVRAMENGEQISADGVPEVPGSYQIALHPKDLIALRRDHPHVDQALASALTTLVSHMQLRLQHPPSIALVADRRVSLHSVHITPLNGELAMDEQTRDLDLSRLQENAASKNASPHSAYLVIEGQRIFDLTAPLTSIGRALDNDLILEDRRISRHHAQLHQQHGRHVLQDLGSTGGTAVNGQPVRETVLHSGDLVSLSGLKLLYVSQNNNQETSDTPDPTDDTRPTPAANG
jgi:hypothetical protein